MNLADLARLVVRDDCCRLVGFQFNDSLVRLERIAHGDEDFQHVGRVDAFTKFREFISIAMQIRAGIS